MEYFTIKSIVDELKEIICGARIIDVFHPAKNDLLLRLRTRDREEHLIISADPESPRIHLIGGRVGERMPISKSFKEHLAGTIIEDMDTRGFDRIVELKLRKDAPGGIELKEYILITELMGRYSNCILIESRKALILECIKRIDEKKSRIRQIWPGAKYIPPLLHGKMHPAEATPDAMAAMLEAAHCADEFSKKAVATYQGLGPTGSKEVYWRWKGSPEGRTPDAEAAWDAFLTVTALNLPRSPEPIFYFDPQTDLPLYLSPVVLKSMGYLPSKRFLTMNEAADSFFSLRAGIHRSLQRKRRLLSCIAAAMEKTRFKRDAISSDIEKMRTSEAERLKGDLIIANLQGLRKGMEVALLMPFGDEKAEPLRIELDPSLTPVENASLIYKRHSKAKRGLLTAHGRLGATEQELEELGALLKRTAAARTGEEIDSLERALLDKEVIRREGHPPKKEKIKDKASPHGIKSFISSDGCNILVGQSDRANDYLLAHFTRGDDIWLHAEGVPGAHAVLKAKGKKIPHSFEAIKEAALLAAHFSKAKGSTSAAVNYAAGKYVKKLRGAGPGKVILHNHKTVVVRLDRENIAQLMKRRKGD